MRFPRRILVPIALFALFARGELGALQVDAALTTELKDATKRILSESSGPEEARRSLARLLDIAVKLSARDSQLSVEFRGKLQTAAKAFGENPLSDKSWEALNAAYKSLNGGKDFAFPNGVKNPGDAARMAQRHVDRSLESLESGASGQAVREILSFILLVITPVMRES